MNWSKIGAITRIEFMMQWRQRLALAAALVICGMLIFMSFAFQSSAQIKAIHSADLPGSLNLTQREQAFRELSTTLLLSLEVMLHFFSLFVFPIILSEALPKDYQYGVRELLETVPLSGDDYLLGKLLGSALTTILSLTLPMIVLGIGWWFMIYPFNVVDYLSMWLVALFPVALLNGALSILLASGQRTRRRAILIGIGLALLSLFLLVFGFGMKTQLSDFLNPSRPLIFKYYVIAMSGGTMQSYGYVPVLPSQIALTIAGGLAEVLIVYWVVRRGLRRLMV